MDHTPSLREGDQSEIKTLKTVGWAWALPSFR